MYKSIKAGKLRLVFNKFPLSAKRIVSVNVYSAGFHKWESFDDSNYSVVFGLFRVIFSIDKNCLTGEDN